MKAFLLASTILLGSLDTFATPQVVFKEASAQEASAIQEHLISFYAQELFEAGLFEDLNTATLAATEEWLQDAADPNKEVHYYNLVSPDCVYRYGYLVFSITNHTAFIDAIYLEKTYRGQGLGRHILQMLETGLNKKNIHTIKLHVFAHNTVALLLYHRLGYIIEKTTLVGDKPIGHHMIKEIIP